MRRRPDFSRRRFVWPIVALGLAAWSQQAPGQIGNIRTDGSVGAAQTLTGPTYLIPQTLGTRSGSNLFHSFSVFNVGGGETARFTTTDSFSNVISRVTGLGIPGPLQPSLINGAIQLSPAAGAPNFFFINPAGVTFGAGASVNVPAAFHVSTAHYLKFPDGNFYADPARASTFSSAPPEAFGFLGPGNPRGAVTINGGTNLATPNAAFQIVAGDVAFDNGRIQQTGAIRVIAMGDAIGEVGLSGTVPTAAGTFSTTNGGLIWTQDSGATPASNVTVAAGTIDIHDLGTGIYSVGLGTANAGNIEVWATQRLSIVHGGQITNAIASSSNGGLVKVDAGSLTIDGQGYLPGISFSGTGILSSNFNSSGTGGALQVTVAGQASVVNSGVIRSLTGGPGDAGPVTVTAGSIFPNSSYSAISSSTLSSGSAGTVTVSPARPPNIVRDGTAGPSIATQPVAASGVYVIPQTFGLTSGSNLFHSFGRFNLDTGETARFTTDDVFSNVISRVTGGTASEIYGRIELLPAAGSAPNFFFINPAGVTFGAGASVNVPAAFHVSTAHYLKFSNGDMFYAADPSNPSSTLSSAQPQAFGFLGPGNPRGEVIVSGVSLATPPNASFQIVAGDVAIDHGGVGGSNLGNVRVIAMGDAVGEAGLSGTVPIAAGNLTLTSSGALITSGGTPARRGGDITVAAGDITISGTGSSSEISTYASPTGGAGNIDVLATRNLTLDGTFSGITTQTLGSPSGLNMTGDTGSMNVNATGQLTIGNGARIYSFTTSPGNGNPVTVNAGSVVINPSSNIEALTWSTGNAASITVNTSSLTIDAAGDRNTGIVSTTRFPLGQYFPHGATPQVFGKSGDVKVTVTNAATLVRGGIITANTFSSGDGGTVTVDAGTLTVRGSQIGSIQNNVTRRTPGGRGGNAGTVNVIAQSLIVDAGQINSDTYGIGDAGAVEVNVGSLTMVNGGIISSTAAQFVEYISTGNGGSVQVSVTGQASISSGSQISSSTYTPGRGGAVTVSAGSLTIDGQGASPNQTTGITSQATRVPSPLPPWRSEICQCDYHPTGDAGSVQVSVTGAASILSGGVISSSTSRSGADSLGNAGTVTVNAGSLTVDGTGSSINAAAAAGSSGQTGNVTVTASDSITLSNGGKLSIENDATVLDPIAVMPTLLSVSAPTITLLNSSLTAASTGNVAASGIHIEYGKLLFVDPSFITTSANTGNGGSILIQGGGPLWLDSSQITTSAGGGIGGDIGISVPLLIMNTGFIQANTQAGAAGGNVSINANAIIASGGLLNVGGLTPFVFDPNAANFNVIQAAAPTGLSGNIAVTAPVVNVSGSLAGLTGNVLSSAGVGRSLCSSSGGSSLAQAGRGGMPASSSDLLTVESSVADQAEAAPARPDRGMNGTPPILLAQCP